MGVMVVGVVVVVVVAQEDFYVSPDLCMSELRKSGSVCTQLKTTLNLGKSLELPRQYSCLPFG